MFFCIVGSGIIGLSTALCLARQFRGCKITVIYDECSPNTTSNHSFGVCSYRWLDEMDGPNTKRWAQVTGKHCAEYVQNCPNRIAEMGLKESDVYVLTEKKTSNQTPCLESFRYYREATDSEIDSAGIELDQLDLVFKKTGIQKQDVTVYKAGTWFIDTQSYLPWLRRELEDMESRGDIAELRFIKQRIQNFSEVFDGGANFDCIVNCSGLGSEHLVPDRKMVPIRGQYVLLEWRDDVSTVLGHHTFICKKSGRIAVGSVYQVRRRDEALDPNDSASIFRRAVALCPKIRDCKVLLEAVGIRPGRLGGPRVEVEWRSLLRPNPVLVIHNYGHGAKGVIQHWGCAMEVADLAMKALKEKSNL